MVKIKVTINGTEHELDYMEALRVYAELSRGLGMISVGTPQSPVPPLLMQPGQPFPPPGAPGIGDAIWIVDPRSQPYYSTAPVQVVSDATPQIRTEHGFAPEVINNPKLEMAGAQLTLPTPTGPVLCTFEQTTTLRRGLELVQEDPETDQSLMCEDLVFSYTSDRNTIHLAISNSSITFTREFGAAMLSVITGSTTQQVHIGN